MTFSPGSDRAAKDAPSPPSFADVEDAARRLGSVARITPLFESPTLNGLAGLRLLIKAEMLQHTGSFKFRGAFNRISRLDPAERAKGVVAYSSGNHGQAVAAVAAMTGSRAAIVMPEDAPVNKIENTRAHGAEIVLYDRRRESREEIAAQIAMDRNATLVPPYDDPLIIAGQGTVGLEIAEQAAEMGATLDAVLVPCGGGGLIAGTALALAKTQPLAKIYSVEPEGFDDTARSLAAGQRLSNTGGGESFCDALLTPMPGAITFAVNRQELAGGLVVGEAEIKRAMALAFRHLRVVLEPSGAVALAAALSACPTGPGTTAAVICSGGNVDMSAFRTALAAAR